jgi:hypothetical protein
LHVLHVLQIVLHNTKVLSKSPLYELVRAVHNNLVPTWTTNLESFRAASCSSLLGDSSLQPDLAPAFLIQMWKINATWPCCHAQSESAWRNEMPFDDHITCPRLHCMTRPTPNGVKSSLFIALCTLPSDLALINMHTWRLIVSSKFCSSVHLFQERNLASAHREWRSMPILIWICCPSIVLWCSIVVSSDVHGLPLLPASSAWILDHVLSIVMDVLCASVAD